MLEELHIRNLAVVEDVVLHFQDGLNVLTGSTGAGKSLILSAVNLLLGGRGSARSIRAGQDSAEIEGVFAAAGSHTDRVPSSTPGGTSDRVRLRRAIDSGGRSRAFVNDQPATLRQLRELAVQLIEPHGQNEQLVLKDPANHVAYLDRFAGNDALIAAYGQALDDYRRSHDRLIDFEKRLAATREKRELLEHRVEEISKARIRPGEREELEASIAVLANGQQILEVLNEAGASIYDDESSVVSTLSQLRRRFSRIATLDKHLGAFAEALEQAEIQLGEVANDMRSYLDRLDFEPERLEAMQERLEFLLGLERRYELAVDDLVEESRRWSEELESLVFEDEERRRLIDEKQAAVERLRDAGMSLGRARRAAARTFDQRMTAEIVELMMRGARFRTDFAYDFDDDGDIEIKGRRIRPRENGFDDVVFFVQTNPGEMEGAVSEVASGGELSRMALAVKSLVTGDREGTVLIFDELDAGVGADMGEMIARRLERLARHYQIVCITHMPQIAARAVNHLVVGKTTRAGRTFARVQSVSTDARVREIARMLGGQSGSEKRLALAREMLHLKQTTTPSNVRP